MDEQEAEHKALRDVSKASRAELLLNDELLKSAFDTLEQAYIGEMILTGVEKADSYKRDRYHQAIHVLRKVKDHLRKMVENGKMAKATLRAIEGKRQQAA